MPVTSTFNFQKSRIKLGSQVTGWLLVCWCGNPADPPRELIQAQVEAEARWALGQTHFLAGSGTSDFTLQSQKGWNLKAGFLEMLYEI